jgi:3-oxoacyl-[acyl-carrier-protein] synthase-3
LIFMRNAKSLEPYGVGILGVGSYIPEKSVESSLVEHWAGLPLGTVEKKTGIRTRYVAEESQPASDLAFRAAQSALASAHVQAEHLDLILCGTFSADYVSPALACKIHRMLGAKHAAAFDLMANCVAFQVALNVASDRLRMDSTSKYALVLGVAVVSRYIDWRDGTSSIYFGDGAGAAVLGKVPLGFGFLSHEVFSNSHAFEAVRIRGGGSSFRREADGKQPAPYLEMSGLDVWKQAAQYQPIAIKRALEKAELSVTDVDFFVFHQANLHLLEYLMAKLRVPLEKTYINVDRVGNTAEASMAIALSEAVSQKRIKHGDIVVISGVGAGFTFGASVLRWYAP